MQRWLIAFMILFSLPGCKLVTEEIKKINKIRKITKEKCDCRYVEVDKDYVDGEGVLTLTVKKSTSEDHAQTADDIYGNLQEKYPNICNYAEVFIIFEGDTVDYDDRFTYFDCAEPAEHDTIFYDDDLNEIEEWDEEDWESFMDSI